MTSTKAFNGAQDKGIIAIPCELIDKNGDNLKRIVKQYAAEWKLEEGFINWLDTACDFCNSLVDRIVPGYPRAEAEKICERLGYQDNLLDSAEIFLLWVIECHGKTHEDELPTDKAGVNVIWTDDMSFYRTRKVRILNGTHTMMVLAAYQTGLNTVEECIKSPLIFPFAKKGLFEEIIPSMDGDKKQLEEYAGDVLERFANPLPDVLTFSLAALISFYEGTEYEGTALKGSRNGEKYLIQDSPEVLEKFQQLYSASYSSVNEKAAAISKSVLSESAWWGEDLTAVPGLEEKVCKYLESIWTDGMTKAIEKI